MANKKTDNRDLGYMGIPFQYDLVKAFIEDHKFFEKIEPIINQNMFTEDNLCRIVGYMKDRYALNESVATYADLETLIRAKISDANKVESLLSTLNGLKEDNDKRTAIDIVEENAEKFFKQQNLTKAINQVYKIVQDGNVDRYDEAEDIIKHALMINCKEDYGYRIFDGMSEAFSDNYRITIPTGATGLDKALNGGLAKGELGVIIAPSSVGKTSATVGFAATAAVNGFKVMHVHFEDEPVNIKRKYYAYLTDFDACELSKPEIRPRAIEIINNSNYKELLNNNIRAFHPLSGEWSPTDIRRQMQKLMAVGFIPDLVIVDYFECMKLEKGTLNDENEYTREGITMRKLESIAHEFNVAIWCPVQGTKDSFNQQYVGLTQAGGSVKKVQIGHVIITFARSDQMAVEGKLNIFIKKFRAGKITKNEFLNVSFNNGTTKFDFSTETDVDDSLDNNQSYRTSVANQVKKDLRR